MKPMLVFIIAIGFSPYAHAYIDPGSGSFMLQMLIASAIGAGLTVKVYFKTLQAKIRSMFCTKETPTVPPSKEETATQPNQARQEP
jgi:hypothetical protein